MQEHPAISSKKLKCKYIPYVNARKTISHCFFISYGKKAIFLCSVTEYKGCESVLERYAIWQYYILYIYIYTYTYILRLYIVY